MDKKENVVKGRMSSLLGPDMAVEVSKIYTEN